MIKYYNTIKKGVSAIFIDDSTTIISTDERVKNFFEPLPFGGERRYDANNLPYILQKELNDIGTVDAPVYELYPFYNEDGTRDLTKELEQVKISQNNIIKTSFNDEIQSGFTTNGILMDADINDMFLFEEGIKYMEALGASDMSVTDKNNMDITVLIPDALIMVQELKTNYFTLRAKKRTLQETITTQLDASSVQAVQW